MRLNVQAGGCLRGSLRVPGDKSISHRAVMLGALAHGTSRVRDCLMSEDVHATIAAFRALGTKIERTGEHEILIDGHGPAAFNTPAEVIDLGNSGTSIRLLMGLLAGLGIEVILSGDESLCRRPMRRVTAPLEQMGAKITTRADGTPPVHIYSRDRLRALDYELPVASAQVKSAVLLAGLFADGTTCVREPSPTRDHTERLLASFGVNLARSVGCVCLNGGQSLRGTTVVVPADMSSAAFFMVGAGMTPGSDLLLEAVGVNPTRTGLMTILRLMGADLSVVNEREHGGEPLADIRVRGVALQGVDIPAELVPLAIDEFPILFIAAATAAGVTRLRGAAELRYKESDRLASMAAGLARLGITYQLHEDGIDIEGGAIQGGTIDSYGDHRIAMAFAMAALRAQAPIVIDNAGPIATSFPNFTAAGRRVGLAVTAI